MFYNETAAVIRKAHARRGDKPGSCEAPPVNNNPNPLSDITASPKLTGHRKLLPKPPRPLESLSISEEDQATSFFFSNYVLDEEHIARGNFRFLPSICRREPHEDLLSITLTSVGMAGLSRMIGSPTMVAASKQKYITALALTNKAIRNPQQALEDRTLIAIMLLGLYEVVASDGKRSLEAWHNHITGAAALLQLRDAQEAQSETSVQISLQMRFTTIVRCLHHGLPVPDTIQEYSRRDQFRRSVEDDIHTQFVDIVIACCSLRAASKQRRLPLTTILHTALQLDAELQAWANSLPEGWNYRTVRANQCEGVLENHYHVYHNLWTANIWNCYRTVRVLLGAMITSSITALPTVSALDSNQRDQSRILMRDLSRDICASAPFHFRRHEQAGTNHPTAVRGYFLFWPLYVAGLADREARPWVVSQLRAIGHKMGIQQAVTLADDLVSDQKALPRNYSR